MSKPSEDIHGNLNYDDFLFPERERVLFSELLHYITENVQFSTEKGHIAHTQGKKAISRNCP